MKKLIALIGFAAFLVAPAIAQDPRTGSRLGERLEDGDALKPEHAMINAHTLARCIVFKRDRTVERFLTTIDYDDYANAAELVFKAIDCEMVYGTTAMTDSMAVYNTPSSMRGLLAEALLRKKGYLDVNESALPSKPMAEGYNKTWFSMTERSNTVDAMSTCFAETKPELLRKLLRTRVTSSEEGAAISEVAGSLGPCLINGAELRANAFTLRAALAEAYFHRAFGPDDNVVTVADHTVAAPVETAE